MPSKHTPAIIQIGMSDLLDSVRLVVNGGEVIQDRSRTMA